MPETKLYVELLSHTLSPEVIAAVGGRICYSDANVNVLVEQMKNKNPDDFLVRLQSQGHLSPIEHASFTFGVEGVSRALLAQITRHRLASFSVQSQRYVAQGQEEGFSFVVPPSIQSRGEEAVARYFEQMEQIHQWYEEWCDTLGKDKREDARFVLPNACETRFIMTMNAREWLHFFQLRACERAQWEIRALAWAVWGHLIAIAPALFSSAGPHCVAGACSEGAMSCRKQKHIQHRAASLRSFVEKNAHKPGFAQAVSRWATDAVARDTHVPLPKTTQKASEWNFDIRNEKKQKRNG